MSHLLNEVKVKYPLWVIKVGGSLLGSPALEEWLNVIAENGRGQVIVVPGGGIFADAVREAQVQTGINDADAHHLALNAMDQFGLLMAAMHKALLPVRHLSDMAAGTVKQQAMVWLPSEMLKADARIPHHWDITSDSLSAWLAGQLSAAHLLLIKSASLKPYQTQGDGINHVMVERLMNDALVDGGLVDFIKDQPYQTWVMHKADFDCFKTAFDIKTLEKHGLLVQHNTY